MSLTFGLQIHACTIPVTKPTPTKGLSVVNGAETKAAKTVRGCPPAKIVPITEGNPVQRNQLVNIAEPAFTPP